MANVTLRRKVNSGSWTNIRREAYEYYGSSDTYGNLGDLQSGTLQLPSGGSWSDSHVYYYRYYKDSAGGKGYQHGLQYVLSPDGYLDPPLPATFKLHVYKNAGTNTWGKWDDHIEKACKNDRKQRTYRHYGIISTALEEIKEQTIEVLRNAKLLVNEPLNHGIKPVYPIETGIALFFGGRLLLGGASRLSALFAGGSVTTTTAAEVATPTILRLTPAGAKTLADILRKAG